MKLAILCLLGVSYASAQQSVAITKQPSSPAVTTLTYYTTSGSPQYICRAFSLQPIYTWAVTPALGQGTLTSIVVLSNVGTVTTSANHGLQVNDVVSVTVSGTAALNGIYVIQTVPSTTTFTITTVGVSNGTYNASGMLMTTTAPRSNANIWSIEQFTYGTTGGASGNPIADQWAVNLSNPNNGGNVSMSFGCDSKSVYGYH
jgi:hypothetical protein